MKYNLKNKLTIIIEASKYKNISQDVLNAVSDFEKKLTSKGVKLSMTSQGEQKKETSKSNYISPENWDYWPV